MSWEGKAVKVILAGFAATVLYAGCSADTVRSKVPIVDETVSAIEQIGYVVRTYDEYRTGERNLDLVQFMMDLHEPTAVIGETGRSIGERYLGLDYDMDLVEGLQNLGDAADPLMDLVDD